MLLFEIETKLYTNLYLSQFILWSIEICIYVHVLVHIYNQLTTHRKKLNAMEAVLIRTINGQDKHHHY